MLKSTGVYIGGGGPPDITVKGSFFCNMTWTVIKTVLEAVLIVVVPRLILHSGVSQSSNLLLEFLININVFPNFVQDAKCLLFVDGLKLLLAIRDDMIIMNCTSEMELQQRSKCQ